MSYEMEQLKFGGRARSIAAEEYAASFADDGDHQLMDMLYHEYERAGAQKSLTAWLRTRLSELFLCVKDRPNWIERGSVPRWPFKDGFPMVFIGQYEVPSTTVSELRLVPHAMLYVFGTRVEKEIGWEAEYHVVEQLADLP